MLASFVPATLLVTMVFGAQTLPTPDQIGPEQAWAEVHSDDPNRLDVTGVIERNGAPNGRSPAVRVGRGSADAQADAAPVLHPLSECVPDWNDARPCYAWPDRPDAPAGDPAPGIPPLTISDLASFAPEPSTLTGEPDNLGVAGLPTNFVVTATTHSRSGELFGYPISVRFTPASVTVDHGDGDTRTSTTTGQSWDALRLPQFSHTDTSHVYTARGTYTARADVTYTAEVDLGTGWFPLTGQLTTTGRNQDIRIFEARTALVAHSCIERPSAPGC